MEVASTTTEVRVRLRVRGTIAKGRPTEEVTIAMAVVVGDTEESAAPTVVMTADGTITATATDTDVL